MKKEKITLTEKPTLYEMFDYLCSKVNWGKTNLDCDAVVAMNKLFIELGKDKTKYEI